MLRFDRKYPASQKKANFNITARKMRTISCKTSHRKTYFI